MKIYRNMTQEIELQDKLKQTGPTILTPKLSWAKQVLPNKISQMLKAWRVRPSSSQTLRTEPRKDKTTEQKNLSLTTRRITWSRWRLVYHLTLCTPSWRPATTTKTASLRQLYCRLKAKSFSRSTARTKKLASSSRSCCRCGPTMAFCTTSENLSGSLFTGPFQARFCFSRKKGTQTFSMLSSFAWTRARFFSRSHCR